MATLSTTLCVVGLAVVTAIGVAVLVTVLVRHRRLDRALAAVPYDDVDASGPGRTETGAAPPWLSGASATDATDRDRTPPLHAH